MCWKIERRSLLSPSKWSLVWQLTFIYTISVFLVFLAATLFLYWIFTSQLERENYHILKNEILILEKLVANHSLKSPILQEEITVESPLEHYYSRIIDAATGKIILETSEMSTKIPASVFIKIMSNKFDSYLAANFISPKQKHNKQKSYLLMASKISGVNNLYIQIAMDITDQKRALEDYREDLLLVLLIGVIGSAIVGVFVARKGLKPLQEITESTQRITISRLKERLNSSSCSWPKELSKLAIAFNEMLDRIEDGFTRISQFASDLAHEFRTPIATLMGEAEIILSKPRTLDEYREALESSLDEFSRLSGTIENLLFLARAENPSIAIEYQLVNCTCNHGCSQRFL